MIALAAILAVVVGLLGVLVSWLVSRNGSLVDQLLAARDNAGKNALDAERSKFNADKADQALAGEQKRERALEDEVTHATTDPGAGLAVDDVDGRVRRIAGQAGVPGDAGGSGTGSTGPVR